MTDADLFPVPDGNTPKPWPLAKPCKRCGAQGDQAGLLIRVPEGLHAAKLICATCTDFVQWIGKKALGDPIRSLTPRGECVKPKQRQRILARDGGRCMLCGAAPPDIILNAGHILSHADGEAHGLPEELIDSDDNLMAMCERCNSGLGKQSLPLYLAEALLTRRRPA